MNRRAPWILLSTTLIFLFIYGLRYDVLNAQDILVPESEIGLLPPSEGSQAPPSLKSVAEEAPHLPMTEGSALPGIEGSAPLNAERGSQVPGLPPTPEGEAPLPAAEGSAPPTVESPQVPSPPVKGYLGIEACRGCHETDYQSWSQTLHGKWVLSFSAKIKPTKKSDPTADAEKKSGPMAPPTGRIDCESCHGPGSLHADDPYNPSLITRFGTRSTLSVREQNEACLQCHHKGATLYWNATVHGGSLSCGACHQVMTPLSSKALLKKPTPDETCDACHRGIKAKMIRSPHRAIQGRGAICTTCHNPHGSSAPGLLTSPSINENCYRCHAEKRGPFLFEHFPVSENCLLCHDAHGSLHQRLLKARQPFLCMDCHTNLPGTHDPLNPNGRYSVNRGCVNCHAMIHGSNHPSGAKFQR